MTIEDELELALRAEAQRIDPPVRLLVEGGVARGRELRRRRRARLAVSGAALVVTAGVGGLVAAPFIGGGDGEPGVSTEDAPVASGEVAPPVSDPAAAAIDPDAVLDAVVALLPPGEVTDVSADAPEPSSAWFTFVHDDGAGASLMQGSVHVMPGEELPTCPVIVNGGTCEVSTLDDGTVLMLMAGPYYPQPDHEPDRLLWSALAVSPDGLRVVLGEMNAATEKDSEPTRPEPPFSLEQLTAVVTDDVWTELTAGVSAESAEQRAAEEAEEEAAAAALADVEASAAARALAETLGPDWIADGDGAKPTPELAAGLPDGYTAGWATVSGFGSELTLEQHCEAGEEKGAVKEACVTDTAPGGETVHVQWGGTVTDGPYAQSSLQDDVSVLVADEGRLVRVSLWVADPAATSTPERRAAARGWLEEQVDDLASAATAALAGDQG